MKHTKGPWEVEILGSTVRVISDVEVTEGGSRIGGDVVLCGDYRNKENIANANLIASAPELLEACKAVLNEPDFIDGLKTKYLVRKAIAKAEGDPK